MAAEKNEKAEQKNKRTFWRHIALHPISLFAVIAILGRLLFGNWGIACGLFFFAILGCLVLGIEYVYSDLAPKKLMRQLAARASIASLIICFSIFWLLMQHHDLTKREIYAGFGFGLFISVVMLHGVILDYIENVGFKKPFNQKSKLFEFFKYLPDLMLAGAMIFILCLFLKDVLSTR